MSRTLAVAACLAVSMSGCGDSPAPSSPPQLEEWTLLPTPVMRIADDGRPETQFTTVRAHKSPTGDIVVFDVAAREIRVFSSDGSVLRTFGGKGSGPGELASVGRVWNSGDTIMIADAQSAGDRVHYYSASTGYLRSKVLAPRNATSRVAPLLYVSNGVVLVRDGAGMRGPQPSMSAGILLRDSTTLGLASVVDETGNVAWLGTFPSITLTSYVDPGQGRTGLTDYPFGPSLVYSVSGGAVWIGDSGTGMITIFDATGSRVREFAVPVEPRPFDTSILERRRDSSVAAAPAPFPRAIAEARYNLSLLPESAPLFTAFLPGVDGEMWVQEYSELPSPPRLVVLDREGRGLGWLRMPEGFAVRDIGRDYVLGIEQDADGVVSVVEYALQRSAPRR